MNKSWAIAALGGLFLANANIRAAAIIAYDNSLTGGLQSYGNNLGLDFTVNTPITITALGAFDDTDTSLLDGVVGGGIDVGIFDLTTHALVPGSITVHFSSTNAGTQTNADAFLPVAFSLPVGSYSVVAFNDHNFNSNGVVNGSSTTNDGGGAITFIGAGRYRPPAASLGFPGTADGGPVNRYDAGTFQFTVPEPATAGILGIAGVGFVARRRRS